MKNQEFRPELDLGVLVFPRYPDFQPPLNVQLMPLIIKSLNDIIYEVLDIINEVLYIQLILQIN